MRTEAPRMVAPAPAPQPLPLEGDGPEAWLAALLALARQAGWVEAQLRQSTALGRAIDAAIRDLHHPRDREPDVGDAGALLESWARWAREAPRQAWAALRRAARRVGEWADRAAEQARTIAGAPGRALMQLASDARRWADWVAAGAARGLEGAYRAAGRGIGLGAIILALGIVYVLSREAR